LSAAVAGAGLVTFLAVVPGGSASAQIAVDQLELVFRTKAGNPRLGIINLRNEGDRAVQAVVKLEDWDRAEDGTNRWYPVGTVAGSCGKALEIFPPTVSLDPGATQAVRVTFDSTAAVEGECWGAAIVETVAPRTAGDRGIRNVIRTATKIYVQAEGLTASGEVVALRPAMMLLKDKPDSVVAFEVGFANTGQRHLVAKGEIQIRRGDNTVVVSLPVPPLYVLPGANGRTKVALPTLAAGRYVVLAILDYGGDELAAGQIEYEVP
jgi:P pilus assembly chaperone PapD